MDLTPERRQEIARKAGELLARYRGYTSTFERLLKIAQDAGIETLEADSFDISGTLRKQDGTWRISINRQDSPTRQLFTLAHELAHYFLHANGQTEFVDGEFVMNRDEDTKFNTEELEANEFAANLVMPEEQIREKLIEQPITEQKVLELADELHVSPLAMVIRLQRLGYATPIPTNA